MIRVLALLALGEAPGVLLVGVHLLLPLADVFGGPNFGSIFELLRVAYPAGGTLAVYVGAIVFDTTGSYLPLIPAVTAALGLWSAALWIAGPRRSPANLGPARGEV